MQLSEFATLAEAQAYTAVNDKKQVGSGQARGYLVGINVWTALRVLQADLTNPLSALADAVIVTASDASSFFGLDADTAEGQGNIASIGIFVTAGVLTQAQAGGFLALAVSTTTPYANATLHDLELTKKTINRTAVIVVNGFCTITTNADTPKHSPQVYRRVEVTTGDYEFIRVAGFNGVEVAGQYRIQCPSFPDLFIDDAYNVVS